MNTPQVASVQLLPHEAWYEKPRDDQTGDNRIVCACNRERFQPKRILRGDSEGEF